MAFDILNAQLPNPSFFLQPDGSVSPGWFQFFLSLSKRTSTGTGNAGGQGISSAVLSEIITALSGSVLTPEQLFAAFAELSPTQQRAFAQALIAAQPNSPAGLAVGQTWNNGGVLTAVEAE